MANQITGPLFLGAAGGISDDKFVGIPQSHQDIRNIEIRKYPSSIKLSNQVEEKRSMTGNGLCSLIVKSTGDILLFDDAGYVYLSQDDGETWTNPYNHPSSLDILGCHEFNDYIYRATAEKLHRIPVSSVRGNWNTDAQINYQSFTEGNTNAHPMQEIFGFLYIGDGYLLAELDSVGTFTANKLSISIDEEIRNLLLHGQVLRIVARKSEYVKFSRSYFWDLVSDAPNEISNREDVKINTMAIRKGTEYAIADNDLYEGTGLAAVLIKSDLNISQFPYNIHLHKNIMYFGCVGGVKSRGSLNKNYPDVLNFDYYSANYDNVSHIFSKGDNLFFCYKYGTGYFVGKVNNSKYQTDGYLITRAYNAESSKIIKNVSEVTVSFSPLATGETITVYYRHDLVSSFTKLGEITSSTATISPTLHIFSMPGEFNFTEFKIELESSGTTSPQIHGLFLDMKIQGQ